MKYRHLQIQYLLPSVAIRCHPLLLECTFPPVLRLSPGTFHCCLFLSNCATTVNRLNLPCCSLSFTADSSRNEHLRTGTKNVYDCVETASSKEVHQTSSAGKSGAAGSCRNSLHSQNSFELLVNYFWSAFWLHSEGSSTSTSQSKKSEGTTKFQKRIALPISRQVLIVSGNGVVTLR